MPFTFPISHPASPGFAEVRILGRTRVGVTESEFTLDQQVYEWEGERWEFDCVLPLMVRALAEQWVAFLLALRGPAGTFLLGPGGYANTPRGIPGGPVLINGPSQLGKTVNIKGMAATTGTFLAGDFISFGVSVERLYKVIKNATADGSGQATLDIWPRLKEATTDNDPVTATNPKGVFRLAGAPEWNVNNAKHYGIQFRAISI